MNHWKRLSSEFMGSRFCHTRIKSGNYYWLTIVGHNFSLDNLKFSQVSSRTQGSVARESSLVISNG